MKSLVQYIKEDLEAEEQICMLDWYESMEEFFDGLIPSNIQFMIDDIPNKGWGFD